MRTIQLRQPPTFTKRVRSRVRYHAKKLVRSVVEWSAR